MSHTIKDVLFCLSSQSFLYLSCASNRMTSTHSDARQTARNQDGRRLMCKIPQTSSYRSAAAQWCQEDMGSKPGGVSWDRTSTLILCRREDPCLGLFVFSVLSPIPILSHPPNPSSCLPEIAFPLCLECFITQFSHASHPSSCPQSDLWPLIFTLLQMEKHSLLLRLTVCYCLNTAAISY